MCPSCLYRNLLLNNSFTSQILDELIIAGEMQESCKKSVLRVVRIIMFHSLYSIYDLNIILQVAQSDAIEDQENSEDTLARLGSRSL